MAVQQLDILQKLSSFQTEKNKITVRVKQLNSVEYKIHRYSTGQLEGKVPINKCFNDLFGIRIIINSDFLNENYFDLKLTDSSKNGYVAS